MYNQKVKIMKIENPIVFFDLETTGVSVANDRICQIACIKINIDGHRSAIRHVFTNQLFANAISTVRTTHTNIASTTEVQLVEINAPVPVASKGFARVVVDPTLMGAASSGTFDCQIDAA